MNVPPHPPATEGRAADDLAAALAELREAWGIDYRRARRVLGHLADGGWVTVTGLVEESGLPRRDVEGILSTLGESLESGDGRMRLRPLAAAALRVGESLNTPVPADPYETAALADPALVARLKSFAARLPPSLWRLDHVPATPLTMARRALFLAGEYDLTGASVLCLGDHDLTSLALGAVEPAAEVAVVDIDERILDHVASVSRSEDFGITTAYADLRLGLPVSLAGSADLVFSDPPYTPDGIRLFLGQGLEALRRTDRGRLLFCYGYGDRHLVRGVEVQAVLQDLRLAVEAVLPGFNRYRGAEAIGSRSSLYVCRPTTKTRRARMRAEDPRIYTRGAAAENAAEATLPEAVERLAAEEAEAGAALVGPGWPLGLAEFAARLSARATSPNPQPLPFGDRVVVNLHPHLGSAVIRVLLLAAPDRAVVLVPDRALQVSGLVDPDDPLHRLLASTYDLAVDRPASADEPAVLVATRHGRPTADPVSAVLAHLVTHPGAKAVNAWREGLISWARRAGGEALSRNDARRRIASMTPEPSLQRLRTWELPLSGLRDLVGKVERLSGLGPAAT